MSGSLLQNADNERNRLAEDKKCSEILEGACSWPEGHLPSLTSLPNVVSVSYCKKRKKILVKWKIKATVHMLISLPQKQCQMLT